MDTSPVKTADAPQSTADAPSPSPLTQEQHDVLRRAGRAYKVIRRATSTALFSAASTFILAIMALPFVAYTQEIVLGIAAILVIGVACVEFRGYLWFKRADRRASRLLAFNQLALLLIIGVYCVAQSIAYIRFAPMLAIPPESVTEFNKMFSQLGLNYTINANSLKDFAVALIVGIYVIVFVVSVIFQGGLAIYYWTRRKGIDAYHASTPGWVRRIISDVG